MKKKLIALILLIPLLLVFTTFSLATVAVLAVPIPVTGIEILMDEVEYLDLSEGGTLRIEARVLPDKAKEKGVTYRAEAVEGKPEAEIAFGEDGALRARSTGSAKIVVTTKDGGYKAGFLLEVSSKSAVGLSFESSSIVLTEGETRRNAAIAVPFTALDKNAEYRAEDPDIVKVDPLTGEILGLLPGKTRVIAKLEAGYRDDGTAWTPSEITAAYRVTVTEYGGADVLVGGRAGANLTEYADGGTELTVSVKNTAYLNAENAREEPSDAAKLEAFRRFAKLSAGSYTAELQYASTEKTAFRLSVTAPEGAVLTLGATEIVFRGTKRLDAAELSVSKTTLLVGERLRLGSRTLPEIPEGLVAAFSVSNEAVARIEEQNGAYFLVGESSGTVDVTFRAAVGSTEIRDTVTFIVAASPKSVNFRLNSKIWGLKERYAYASKKYAGGVEAKDSLLLELISDGAVDYADYDLTSSDSSVAEIINGRLYVRANGTVTVRAVPKNADTLGIPEEYYASLTLDCVDGINVTDYESLRFASAKGRKIVLQADVAVGKDVKGLSTEEKKRVLRDELLTIPTTADWSYYRRQNGAASAPAVKVAIEFKDDVFGNGYALNAHNVTSVVDGSNLPLYDAGFGGPLYMVAAAMSGLSANVKAQDNIVFLVRNDNVKIDNVELLSRDLVPNDQGLVELNDLNYAGTTLEIMGDGVSLTNSRVRNGRTAVRIFGGADADRKIGVKIESCILTYAREFLLKIGTNKTVPSLANASNPDELQPKFAFGGKVYEPRRDENFSDADFVGNFVKTEVTVENCAFSTSGIFAVGVESKFGGTAFQPKPDGGLHFDAWFEASGTSYPARLKFEGNVGLYDWKDVEKIDSSTLIETSGAIPGLDFDVAAILKKVAAEQPDRFGNILSEYGGARYAHGGVAFYGGGKNYSALDVSGLDTACDTKRLKEYSVPLTVLGSNSYLVAAAGAEPFRFFMFDKTVGMSVEKQNELLFNGKAFDVPPAR